MPARRRAAGLSLLRQTDAVRRFNRFYTRRIGVLEEHLLESPYSLTQVRVLYEIAHREEPTATALRRDLGLDAGYLSRIVRGLETNGLVLRRRSATDGRESLLSLTAKGRRKLAPLEKRSDAQVSAMLRGLPGGGRLDLLRAMVTIEGLLDPAPAPAPAPTPKPSPPPSRSPSSEPSRSYRLRAPRPGDMGWIVHRHGVLYSQEYGWDATFEALVAEIVAGFVQRFDPERERCWVAESGGEVVGSVFLVRKSAKVAKLRLLYVEPHARGMGIGQSLVAECVEFARERGYERVVLWTQSILGAARHLYEEAGFRRIAEEAHVSFGKKLVAETWEKRLGGEVEGGGR